MLQDDTTITSSSSSSSSSSDIPIMSDPKWFFHQNYKWDGTTSTITTFSWPLPIPSFSSTSSWRSWDAPTYSSLLTKSSTINSNSTTNTSNGSKYRSKRSITKTKHYEKCKHCGQLVKQLYYGRGCTYECLLRYCFDHEKEIFDLIYIEIAHQYNIIEGNDCKLPELAFPLSVIDNTPPKKPSSTSSLTIIDDDDNEDEEFNNNDNNNNIQKYWTYMLKNLYPSLKEDPRFVGLVKRTQKNLLTFIVEKNPTNDNKIYRSSD